MAIIGGNWPDVPTDGPDSRGRLVNFPEDTPGLTSDQRCALHTIIEMLNVVCDRVNEIEKEIGLKKKLEDLVSNK